MSVVELPPTRVFPHATRAFRIVLAGISKGLSVDQACAQDSPIRLPVADTFWKWISRNELAQLAYTRAKARGIEALVDGMVPRIANIDSPDAAMMRVRVDQAAKVNDAIKWQASKLLPKLYGDRMQHEHSGSVSIALATGIPLDAETIKPAILAEEAEQWPDAIDAVCHTVPAAPAALPAPASPVEHTVTAGPREPARVVVREERRPSWLD